MSIGVKKLSNGQYEIKRGKLKLVQTIIDGQKFNDCSINHSDYNEIASQHDSRFGPLFQALYDYKENKNITKIKLS